MKLFLKSNQHKYYKIFTCILYGLKWSYSIYFEVDYINLSTKLWIKLIIKTNFDLLKHVIERS